ncbi:MAG: TetR family transcriptional regulator [Microbacterium sp. 70-38]|nr:MAG: TetR family transcriptional regulator [Microbacterium sp. 70-38]
MSRADSAASTRAGLLRAASELLDEGGTDAVTLRAVGARAGVSRGAPYGHFESKEHLLTALSVQAWEDIADELAVLRADLSLTPGRRLELALFALIDVARSRPHLYSLMFVSPHGDPEAAVRAAGRSQDEFLAIVGDLVGEENARRNGALLLSSAHGIAGLELSGHLGAEKWHVDADTLVGMLVRAIRVAADGEETE